MDIRISYRSVDGGSKTRTYKTLDGARKFAQKWVGETPEYSQNFGYAVSPDGVGRVTCSGCSLLDLFPKLADDHDREYAEAMAEAEADRKAYEAAMEAEYEAERGEYQYYGDGLHCPHHPHVVVSNGMFDAPCYECESEMEAQDRQYDEPDDPRQVHTSEPDGPSRGQLDDGTFFTPQRAHLTIDPNDDIPF